MITKSIRSLIFAALLLASPSFAACPDLLYFSPSHFITAHVGHREDFSGPNCFNTALRATGVLPAEEIRYVHHSEFQELLKLQFDPVVGKPLPGDLVLYNPRYSPDHAAVWMGDGKVFDKKDVASSYSYRVVGEDNVFKADPEDPIDPFGESGGKSQPVEKGPLKKAFFRKKLKPVLLEIKHPEWTRNIQWIDSFSTEMIRIASKRKIGDQWGFITEELMTDLLNRWKVFSESDDVAARLAWKKLESLDQQVFQSIESSHFSSRYASARAREITTEICWQNTAEFRTLLGGLIQVLRTPELGNLPEPLLEQKISQVIEALKPLPRYPCKLGLLARLL